MSLLVILSVYAAGVGVGLWRVDGSPAARLAVAVCWPLGVVAAVVTVGGLLLASLVLFPRVGGLALGLAAAAWWLAR